MSAQEECDDGNVDAGDCCSPDCRFEGASTICRPAVGPCDAPERCPEDGAACPPDRLRADGEPCERPPCYVDGRCEGGSCRDLVSRQCGSSTDGCCPRNADCSLLRDADCGPSYSATAIAQPVASPGPARHGDANAPVGARRGSGAGDGGARAEDVFLGDGGAASVAVLEGDGRGGFALSGIVSAAGSGGGGGAGVLASASVADLAFGDIDRDGRPDLVVALAGRLPNTDEVAALFGDGALGFTPGPKRRLAGKPIRIELAELTADGALDAVVATDAGLEVLRGIGDGSFTSLALLEAGDLIADVTIGSTVAGGNRTAIVAALRDEGRVTVYERRGDLIEEASRVAAEQPRALAVGDFTGDGLDDLAVASDLGFVAVHPGLAAGGFGEALAERVEEIDVGQMRRADANADSIADLVVLEGASGVVKILVGRGDGIFDVVAGPTASGPAAGLVVADFNGDRIPDLIVSGPEVVIGIGSVAAPPIVAGDATGEGDVDESDVGRLIAEIYDGDGTDALSCGGGGVASAPGADANADRRIDAADLVGTAVAGNVP